MGNKKGLIYVVDLMSFRQCYNIRIEVQLAVPNYEESCKSLRIEFIHTVPFEGGVPKGMVERFQGGSRGCIDIKGVGHDLQGYDGPLGEEELEVGLYTSIPLVTAPLPKMMAKTESLKGGEVLKEEPTEGSTKRKTRQLIKGIDLFFSFCI
ncbi:hypothetical protein ACLOJK_012340 [Asimina triloba]